MKDALLFAMLANLVCIVANLLNARELKKKLAIISETLANLAELEEDLKGEV